VRLLIQTQTLYLKQNVTTIETQHIYISIIRRSRKLYFCSQQQQDCCTWASFAPPPGN